MEIPLDSPYGLRSSVAPAKHPKPLLPKKILFVSSEFAGIAQTGGLGQVSRDLPLALKKDGFDVRVVIPYYRQQFFGKTSLTIPSLYFRPGIFELGCAVYSTEVEGVTIYLIDHEKYFNRPRLYDDGYREYHDNPERFALLSYGALEIADNLGFFPDIVHCNDWQTSLVPLYLSRKRSTNSRFAHSKSLLTIHNGAFQGKCSAFFKDFLGLYEAFNPEVYEDYQAINLLKGGIFLADAVNTVSPGYAKELLTYEGGHGLHGMYLKKGERFIGILNGCNYASWNPATDPYLIKNYTLETLEDKKLCKKSLITQAGLKKDEKKPLVGMVSRITEQKGFFYTIPALEGLLKLDLQVILLGDGESELIKRLHLLRNIFPKNFSFYNDYQEPLAHQIEAGSDVFLMPSLFEPCGLNQIYSLKYGTPPIVRSVGGLKNSVVNYDAADPSAATGFMFELPTAEAVYHTTVWALEVYNNQPAHFLTLMKNGMKQDFSWEKAVSLYSEFYERIKNNFSKAVPFL